MSKKKNGASNPPSFNPRSMEKMMRDLSKLLEQQNFESVDEANAFLEQFMGAPLPEMPAADDPLSQATELVFQAFGADTEREAIQLARKALKVCPDCADAYVLLAEVDAPTLEKAHGYFKKGVEAGRRALGEEMFEENTGHFWYIHETRPYMRALAGLADTSWALGETEEALKLFWEILRLNPGDNQGVRYLLSDYLIEEERFDELEKLFADYQDDQTANWLYNRALTLFCTEGSCEDADAALDKALAHNRFVADFLLLNREMPDELPPYVGFGDENEAVSYVAGSFANWRFTYGAIRWLRKRAVESKIKPLRKR